jgi:hypothetical protein
MSSCEESDDEMEEDDVLCIGCRQEHGERCKRLSGTIYHVYGVQSELGSHGVDKLYVPKKGHQAILYRRMGKKGWDLLTLGTNVH